MDIRFHHRSAIKLVKLKIHRLNYVKATCMVGRKTLNSRHLQTVTNIGYYCQLQLQEFRATTKASNKQTKI